MHRGHPLTLGFCERLIKYNDNEHFSSIFLDEGRFAFLHSVQDCHNFVFTYAPFHSLMALCASDPVCDGTVWTPGVPSASRKAQSGISEVGRVATADATRRRSLSLTSFERDVFCVISGSARNADSCPVAVRLWRTCCASGIFIGKEKATHFGHPLTGAIHIDCDFGKGPWVRQRGKAVQQF